jgi:hypothetical protein
VRAVLPSGSADAVQALGATGNVRLDLRKLGRG